MRDDDRFRYLALSDSKNSSSFTAGSIEFGIERDHAARTRSSV